MNMMLNPSGARATVYTTLGQTLRVPLRPAPGTSPERQLISWFNRQSAANPAFPVRVKSILLVVSGRPCTGCRQALLQYLNRWRLGRKLRVLTQETSLATSNCSCRKPRTAARSALEVLMGEAEMADEAVGPYRKVRGHHIHQSASYGPGRARDTNPNHQAAVAIQQGVRGFTEAQHKRASAVQRLANQGYRGQNVRQQAGRVRVSATGNGQQAPTGNQWFEDQKAYYALRAAGKTPAEAYRLVMHSARQLAGAGSQPRRVPGR